MPEVLVVFAMVPLIYRTLVVANVSSVGFSLGAHPYCRYTLGPPRQEPNLVVWVVGIVREGKTIVLREYVLACNGFYTLTLGAFLPTAVVHNTKSFLREVLRFLFHTFCQTLSVEQTVRFPMAV